MLRMELDKGEVAWDESRRLFICRRSAGTAHLKALPNTIIAVMQRREERQAEL